MKRLLTCLLALSLLLACIGCGSAAAPSSTEAEDLTIQSGTPRPAGDREPTAAGPPAGPEAGAPADASDAAQQPEDAPEAEVSPEEPYVRTIDPTGPMVALTFDDGPHQVYTGQILDILEENHAVATFFEVGVNAARYPDVLTRMAELGCEIGSHSNAHKDLSKLKQDTLLADLDAADQAIAAATGQAPTLLRPPYGAVNKTVKYATGRSVITWTVDTQDWLSQDAQKVIDSIQSLESLDGEIVLLHSTYETTVEAMKTVVPWLIEEGYQLVTVSELMAYYYGELLQPGQFYGYTYFTTHGRTDTPLQLPAESETAEEAPAQEAESDAPSSQQLPVSQPAEDPATDQPAQPPSVPVSEEPVQPSTPPAAEQLSPSPAPPEAAPDLPADSIPEEQPALPSEEVPTEEPLPEEEPVPVSPEEGAELLPPAEEQPPADTEPPGWL